MYKFIDKWDGVQFSKAFIAEFNESGKTMEWTKFSTQAKNHQDQTSWKICGKFFAQYISQANQVIIIFTSTCLMLSTCVTDDGFLCEHSCDFWASLLCITTTIHIVAFSFISYNTSAVITCKYLDMSYVDIIYSLYINIVNV